MSKLSDRVEQLEHRTEYLTGVHTPRWKRDENEKKTKALLDHLGIEFEEVEHHYILVEKENK